MSSRVSLFKNHPNGLMVLFFTEMWERFGFYTMMAILTLYMVDTDSGLGLDTARSGLIYGLFVGGVYFSPLIGGLIADKLLGYRKTILIGALILAIGYGLLSVPPHGLFILFYLALTVVVFGNGFFKPNISVLVGRLYAEDSPYKDAAFNIFYMGINIGAFFAPLVASFLRHKFNFNIAFLAAAIGMIISFITFESFKRHYMMADLSKGKKTTNITKTNSEAKEEHIAKRVTLLIIVFIVCTFFWVAFFQNGFALTLFAKDSTRIVKLLPPEVYQVFNPLFIVILTPLVLAIFSALRRRGLEPSTLAKMGIGMIIMAVACLIMVFASLAGGNYDNNSVSPVWLMATYFFTTIGEICLSPIGLSFVSKLAPRNLNGLMMGGWFVSLSLGGYGSGWIGSYYDKFPHSTYFLILTICLLVMAFLTFITLKIFKDIVR